MRGPSRLFRQEALEHHAGGQRWGEELYLGPAWARRAPVVLAALVVPLVVAGLTVHVDDSASGRFLPGSDGASVAVVLPASARSALAQGTRLDLSVGGGRRIELRVPAADVSAITAEDARSRFGPDSIAGLLATSSPLVVVQAGLGETLPKSERAPGAASVLLGSRALMPMLLSGLFDRGSGG
ncbi:MAG TPA: hypothetical protein VMU20_14095 [Candidatus Dormibacteraeota bacterium]|nr:hypothetical protein [Candidatus Dormibacteraeota bacterium]